MNDVIYQSIAEILLIKISIHDTISEKSEATNGRDDNAT